MIFENIITYRNILKFWRQSLKKSENELIDEGTKGKKERFKNKSRLKMLVSLLLFLIIFVSINSRYSFIDLSNEKIQFAIKKVIAHIVSIEFIDLSA